MEKVKKTRRKIRRGRKRNEDRSTTTDTTLEKVDKDFQQKKPPGLIYNNANDIRKNRTENIKRSRKMGDRKQFYLKDIIQTNC